MRTYMIGICSEDPEYASGLMLALNRVSKGEIEAMVFSRPEALGTCLPVHEPDLLVMDVHTQKPEEEKMRDREIKEIYGIPVCRLTEEPSEDGIFKYQSVREICQELLSHVRRPGGVGSQCSSCIAVFSPLGRCGKTALARALAGKGETGGGLCVELEEYAERSVHSEVLYQIKQRTPDIYEAVVREQVMEDGTMVLHVSGMYSELRDVQAEDLKWLHGQLLQPGRYQRLVYDIGSASLSDLSGLMTFDRIYMPVLSDERSVRKVNLFRETLRERRMGELLMRILPVELPEDAVLREDARQILKCVEACA